MEQSQEKWQPIETAPTDIRVLVFVPIKHHRLVIAIQTEYGLWLNEAYKPMPYPPSHWMALPEPPQQRKEEEGKDGKEREATPQFPGQETAGELPDEERRI